MTLAVVIAIITMISAFGIGIYLFTDGQTVLGIVTTILGPIVSWIAGFFLYGFGRLIDNSDYIAYKMGRRDGYGIPDVSDKIDWSTPDEDDIIDDDILPPSFIAQRIVRENTDVEKTFTDVPDGENEYVDPMLSSAIELALERGKISTSMLQRELSLGYGRSAKLIDDMEKRGYISAYDGPKPRVTLITREQYEEAFKK